MRHSCFLRDSGLSTANLCLLQNLLQVEQFSFILIVYLGDLVEAYLKKKKLYY